MDALPIELERAARGAVGRLSGYAYDVAASGADGRGPNAAPMAGAAREAIFADALLGAVRARLEEFKAVAK